jgi:hypothetical protein
MSLYSVKRGMNAPYSMTSLACAITPGGMVSLKVAAALRFTINANSVGSSIGRSAGLVPLTMRSMK